MSPFHAVVWIDHHKARVLQFDVEQVEVRKVQAHTHETRQQGGGLSSDDDFFGEVCDELDGIDRALVTGSDAAQAEFRDYVDKHRPTLGPQIVGWETVEHPAQSLLVALARQYFRQTGVSSPAP
ncbi:MAG: hypothetical protein ABJA61_02400 [Caldimonas sp.]